MARLDPSRSALELDEEELAVVGLLLTDPESRALRKRRVRAVVAELERAGVVAGGSLTEDYAARMMAVIGDPQLRVMVQRFGSDAPAQFGPFAAVRDGVGVWCETTREGATEFTPIEPELVPRAVAEAVGLGPRAEPAAEGALELRGGTLQRVLDRLARADAEGAERALEKDTSLDEIERRLLIKLFLERRLSWRAFSVWKDSDGEPQTLGVAVVDGGESGLWLSDWNEHEPNQSDRTIVRLEPTTSSAVWDRLVELVP